MIEEGGGASRSTDPAAGSSAATDVSLREYLMAQINAAEKRADLRFEHMKETVEAAFRSAQMAIDKADTATEKRFEGVNEFRAALSDQAVNFVTRDAMSSLGKNWRLRLTVSAKTLTTSQNGLICARDRQPGHG